MKNAHLVLAAIVFLTATRAELVDFKAMLPSDYKSLRLDRYQSTHSYDDTKREIKKRFQTKLKLEPEKEINLPHVRAITYHHLDQSSELLAINIYLNMQTGLTNIFFVRRSRFS